MRIDYKKVKPLSEEAIAQKDVKLAVEKTKLQLASDILATESAIADAQERLEVLKTTYPLDTEALVACIDEINSLKEGIAHLQEIKEELGL